MTKYLTATLVALVVSLSAFGGTFVVPQGASISGSPDGTISWSGVSLGTVVHFRDVNSAPVEYRVSGSSGSVKLEKVAEYGGRFQVRDGNGNWSWLTPQGARFNLVGVHLDCSHPDGCALEVNGTGSKSGPVPHHQGGVYQGYAPAQQLASTEAENPRQAYSPCHPKFADWAPQELGLTCKDGQVVGRVVGGASQSTSAGKYKLVPVGRTEAEKAGMKPVAKAKAVAKATPSKDECVAGKPIELKDGTVVQCIPKLLTRIGDAPEPIGAAPAAPAASTATPAPATPSAPAPAKKS